MATDTIAAISTAPGRGAIAVVRVSGPESIDIVDSFFRGKESLGRTRSHSVRHGRLVDSQDAPLDDVLVSVMRAPDTYTGEDVVEINCHGGMVVSRLVLQSLVEAGCRPAEPGEFTRRAFLNDRIDLAQAEAVAELVAAKTRRAAERALKQLEGELSSRIRAVRSSIVGVLAELEARIDFPDDVPDDPELEALRATLSGNVRALEEIVSERTSFALLSEGVRIPIIGKPNVGKSSLFNAITGRKRVIVSPSPGTTRDTVEEEVELDGVPVRLIDTAGLGGAAEGVDGEGVRRTMEELRLADFVIFVVDASDQAYTGDIEILALIGKTPCLVAANKVDLAPPSAAHSALATRTTITPKTAVTPHTVLAPRVALSPHSTLDPHVREVHPYPAPSSETSCCEPPSCVHNCDIVDVSATQGTGISELRRHLASRIWATNLEFQDSACASRRHVDSLRAAMEGTERARCALEAGAPEEVVAFELREAAQELGSITGERIGPDLLDSIFSKFCVGK